MQPLTYPLTLFRDALLTTYPQMKHLMCYFHVAKCCKDQLKRCTKAAQKSIMDEVYYLHCSSCEEDFIERYEEIMPRWRTTVPDFADYFQEQWNNGDDFTNWKIFCSEPGVVSTNNALESFNKTIKKSYTFGTRHCLSALFDIILDRLIVDLSLDLMSKRKAFEVRRNPPVELFRTVNLMSNATYSITNVNSVYKFTKLETNHVHYVDFDAGTCSCPCFLKHGYCKHIIYLHKKKNVDSNTIIIDRRFKYKGNTRMTQRQRGRVQDAAPALVRN